MSNKIQYRKTDWVDNETALNATELNRMESGIKNACDAIDNLADWAKQSSKPIYTAKEVDADERGMAINAIAQHELNSEAHSRYLAKLKHKHLISDIDELDKASVGNSKKLAGENAEFYLDYKNMINTPEPVTRTSQLVNDGDGTEESRYLTQEDLIMQASGNYTYPYISTEQEIYCGFRPTKVVIYERVTINGLSASTPWEFTTSEYKSTYHFEFTKTGFKLYCQEGTAFNKIGYKYYWIATCDKQALLPQVGDEDNGKLLQVINGTWQAAFSDTTFKNDLYITHDVGEIVIPQGKSFVKLDTVGKTAEEVINMIVCKVRMPQVVQPSASVLIKNQLWHEIGESFAPEYKVEFNPGSYEFGPRTGVSIRTCNVIARFNDEIIAEYPTLEGIAATKIFQFPEDKYTFGIVLQYSAGQVPYNNLQQRLSEQEREQYQIKEGQFMQEVAVLINPYYKTFFGTFTEKQETLDSNKIRALNSEPHPIAKGDSFKINIPQGCKQVTFAYPVEYGEVSHVIDTKVLGLDIVEAFKKHIEYVDVASASGQSGHQYITYSAKFAEPTSSDNVYIVTI